MRKGNPNFAGVDPDRHELPREYWSSEDWQEEAALHKPIGVEVPAAPTGPRLSRFKRPPKRWQNARSRAVDDVLDRLRVRPRR